MSRKCLREGQYLLKLVIQWNIIIHIYLHILRNQFTQIAIKKHLVSGSCWSGSIGPSFEISALNILYPGEVERVCAAHQNSNISKTMSWFFWILHRTNSKDFTANNTHTHTHTHRKNEKEILKIFFKKTTWNCMKKVKAFITDYIFMIYSIKFLQKAQNHQVF